VGRVIPYFNVLSGRLGNSMAGYYRWPLFPSVIKATAAKTYPAAEPETKSAETGSKAAEPMA
jgi:hypothetical protein